MQQTQNKYFDAETAKEMFEEAKEANDDRELGSVEPNQFADEYFNESRAELNMAIWNANLPVQHPTEDKSYETLREAFGKLVYDAEFYVDTWENAVEVLRQSPYPTLI
jgi:hypothetical protein